MIGSVGSIRLRCIWLVALLSLPALKVESRSIVGYGDYSNQNRIGPLVADPLAPEDALPPQNGAALTDHINLGVSTYDQHRRISYNVVMNTTGGHWLVGAHTITGNRTVWLPLSDPPAAHIVYVHDLNTMLAIGTANSSYAVMELDLVSGISSVLDGVSALDQGGSMLLADGATFDLYNNRYYVLLTTQSGANLLYRLQVSLGSSLQVSERKVFWANSDCSPALAPCIPQLPITTLLFDSLKLRGLEANPTFGLMALVETSVGAHKLMQLEPQTGVSTVLIEYPAGSTPVLWGAQYDQENQAVLLGTCTAAALSSSQSGEECKLQSCNPASGEFYGSPNFEPQILPYRIGRAVLLQPADGVVAEDTPLAVVGLQVSSPDGHDQLELKLRVAVSAESGHLVSGETAAGWDAGCAAVAGRAYGAACGIGSYADELAFVENRRILVAEGTATEINQILMQLWYRGTSNFAGNDNLTVSVYEESYTNGVFSALPTDTIHFKIDVSPVNDQPKIWGRTNIGMALESRVPLASVRIWDPDGDSTVHQVMATLQSSTSEGIFTIQQTGSAADAFSQVTMANVRTGVSYTGTEESVVSFWGPIEAVNTLLQKTIYSLKCQTAQNLGQMACPGADTITVSADDLGNNGAGPDSGYISESLTIAVVVDCSLAEAPAIQSARFSNDALALLVSLDGPGNMYPNLDTSQFDCLQLIARATVNMMGESPICQWSDNQLLVMSLGAGATIVPLDTVAFKGGSGSDSVRFDCPTSVLASHGASSALLKPEIPLVPQVTVAGPQRIGVCDPFNLYSSVAGTGSRAVSYNWVVRPEGVPYEDGEVQYDTAERLEKKSWINETFNPVIAEATARIFVEVHHLEPDHVYIFMLAATNFLEETSEFFSFELYKLGSPVPQIWVKGSSQVTSQIYSSISLYGGGKVASCLNPGSIQYEFELLRTHPENSLAADNFRGGMISMKNELLVPKYVGTASVTFEIQLKGSMLNNGTLLSSWSTANLSYSQGDLIAVLVAPSSHGNGKDLVLDASSSQDEDVISPVASAFAYSWSCITATKQPCVDMAGDNFDSKYFSSDSLSKVVIPKNSIQGDTTSPISYTFGVTISSKSAGDTRVSTPDSKTILVSNGALPTVVIERTLSMAQADVTKSIPMKGIARTDHTQAVVFEWFELVGGTARSLVRYGALTDTEPACTDKSGSVCEYKTTGCRCITSTMPTTTNADGEDVVSVDADGQVEGVEQQLSLSAGYLPAAVTGSYTFQLRVTDYRGTGYDNVVITTNKPPSGGTVTVSPLSGSAMSTLFTFEAQKWQDDLGDFPLAYYYTYVDPLDPTEEVPLVLDPVASEFFEDVELPQEGIITVKLYVQDKWGARTSTAATVQVTVSESMMDSAKVEEQEGKYGLAYDTGDFSKASLSMVGVAQGMNKQAIAARADRRTRRDDATVNNTRNRHSVVEKVKELFRNPLYESPDKSSMEFKMLEIGTAEQTEVSDITTAIAISMLGNSTVDVAQQSQCLESGVIKTMTKVASHIMNSQEENRNTRLALATRRDGTVSDEVAEREAAQKDAQMGATQDTVASIARAQRRCMVAGSKPKTSESANIKVASYKHSQSSLSSSKHMSSSGSSTALSVEIPSDILSGTDTSTQDDVETTIVEYTTPVHTAASSRRSTTETSSLELSSTFSVKMTAGSLGAEQSIAIADLSNKIKFVMPFVGVMPTDYEQLDTQGPLCQYWNKSSAEWTTDGVTLQKIRCSDFSEDLSSTDGRSRYCNTGTVTCETSHLSDFVAKAGSLPEFNTVDPFGGYDNIPDLADNWMVLIAVGVVYLLYFGCLVWGIYKDKAMVKRLRRLEYFGYNVDTSDNLTEKPLEPDADTWTRIKFHVSANFKKTHNFVKIWAVTPHDIITRPQMITHVLSIVLSALTATCMFFSLGSDSGTVAIDLNPLQLIVTALGTSIIVIPPNVFFGWAFEYAAIKQRLQEDINACVVVPGDFKPLGYQAQTPDESKIPATALDKEEAAAVPDSTEPVQAVAAAVSKDNVGLDDLSVQEVAASDMPISRNSTASRRSSPSMPELPPPPSAPQIGVGPSTTSRSVSGTGTGTGGQTRSNDEPPIFGGGRPNEAVTRVRNRSRRTSVASNISTLPKHLQNDASAAAQAGSSSGLPLPVLPPPPVAPGVGPVLPRSMFDRRGKDSPVFGFDAAAGAVMVAQRAHRATKRRPRKTTPEEGTAAEEGAATDVDGREPPGDRQARMEEEVTASRAPGYCTRWCGLMRTEEGVMLRQTEFPWTKTCYAGCHFFCLCQAYVVLLYGIQFEQSVGQAWMISAFTSLSLDFFVTEPIKIVIIALALAMLNLKTDDDESEQEDQPSDSDAAVDTAVVTDSENNKPSIVSGAEEASPSAVDTENPEQDISATQVGINPVSIPVDELSGENGKDINP